MSLAALGPARAQVSAPAFPLAPNAASAAAAAPAVRQPTHPAALQTTALVEPSSRDCRSPAAFVRFAHPLLRTAQRLAGGKPLTIVAIGSSSTAGAGASSAAASYPNRLAADLRKLFPGRDITVLNRGVGGEETADMLARFASGVIAERPHLVLWQIGTNSVLRDHPLKPHATLLRMGIDLIKATGADVVLIDPQYAPKVLAKSETAGMIDLIALMAKQENVDLFPRFAIMHSWYEDRGSFDLFVSRDGLHMNDWGYACWAKLLAAAIANAASAPLASAAPPGMTERAAR